MPARDTFQTLQWNLNLMVEAYSVKGGSKNNCIPYQNQNTVLWYARGRKWMSVQHKCANKQQQPILELTDFFPHPLRQFSIPAGPSIPFFPIKYGVPYFQEQWFKVILYTPLLWTGHKPITGHV